MRVRVAVCVRRRRIMKIYVFFVRALCVHACIVVAVVRGVTLRRCCAGGSACACICVLMSAMPGRRYGLVGRPRLGRNK